MPGAAYHVEMTVVKWCDSSTLVIRSSARTSKSAGSTC